MHRQAPSHASFSAVHAVPSPSSSSSSARCACSRFSAWSTTTEFGPVQHRVVDLDVAPDREAVHHDPLAAAGGLRTRPGVSRQSRSAARWAASSSGLP